VTAAARIAMQLQFNGEPEAAAPLTRGVEELMMDGSRRAARAARGFGSGVQPVAASA